MDGGAMDGGYDDGERDGWRGLLPGGQRRGSALALHAVRVTVWSVAHFAFALAQQLAELLAPLFLVIGLGWYALPRVLGLIRTGDGQMQDILNGLQSHVPTEVDVAGHVLTPFGLVFDGILLMAIAAALSTLTAVLSRELYRRG